MKVFLRNSSIMAVLVASAMVGSAQALPVATWTFSTNETFSNATWTDGDGTTNTTASRLTWGQTGGSFLRGTQSALTVGTGTSGPSRYDGGPATGSINTTEGGSPSSSLGQIGIGTSLTHFNNSLSSNLATLTGATITDTLTLTPVLPSIYAGRPDVLAPTLVFNFRFEETPNAGNSFGLCANGMSAGSYANGCPDLFGFNGVTLNNPFFYADPGSDNTFGTTDDLDRQYFASIFVLDTSGGVFPIQQLVLGECKELGLNEGCFGFRTLEGAATTAQFAFAVTTSPIVIPEPESIALIGLGLVCLGFIRRMKA